MKKVFNFILMIALFSGSLSAHGVGEASSSETSFRESIFPGAYYEIIAEPGAEGRLPSLTREMELRFEEYNRLFRFNPASLTSPLRVRVFENQEAYNSYLISQLGSTRAGAVYLHYRNIDRRELVIHQGGDNVLAHQAFLQFFRAFIPNPPAWMLEGFSIYFSSLSFDSGEEKLHFEENLAWLDTVKSLGSGMLSTREIILRDTVQIHDASGITGSIFSRDFQLASWALVSFFINTPQHFRSLSESFMVLSPQFSAFENSYAVMDRLSLWIDFYDLDREFVSYINSRKTFEDLMEEGSQAFIARDYVGAEFIFTTARNQRPSHFGPYYYLGLIYYEDGLFELAESNYLLSLNYGANEALVFYALGLNAISADNFDDARLWLQRAGSADPVRYRLRAEELIERLR